jgi:hypothetical protein
MAAVRAGAAWFGLVFALGFLFGALRQWLMGFGLSRGLLVAIEVPLILAFAWWAAGWCARRFMVPIAAGPRLAMGLVMLLLLRLGELAVGVLLMGQTVAGHFIAMASTAGLIEAAPQILTALFPLVRARSTGR